MLSVGNDNDTTDDDDWYADYDPSEFASHDYQRDLQADDSVIDVNAVNILLGERLQARKTGRFERADAIRQELLQEHGVRVNDRLKLWRSGCSTSGSGAKWGQRQPERRGPKSFGPHGHDYYPSPGAGPSTSNLDESAINALLAERLECKLNRDFARADAIQEQLFQAGVAVHDGLKEWRADGQGFGDYSGRREAKPSRQRGSRKDRNRPYQQSSQSYEDDANKQIIQDLVSERMEARQHRDYDLADAIRDELLEDYNVAIDDRLRQWSMGGKFDVPTSQSKRPYIQARSSSSQNVDQIQALVEQRARARQDRDFQTADAIRQELLDEYNVYINDRLREWSVIDRRGGSR